MMVCFAMPAVSRSAQAREFRQALPRTWGGATCLRRVPSAWAPPSVALGPCVFYHEICRPGFWWASDSVVTVS